MNFGGPIDLTPFGALLKGIGWLYWLIALSIILLALWWPKRWWVKLLAAAVVAGAVVYPVFVRPVEKRVQALKAEQQAAQARFDAAKAVFDERCKSAGEKIVRTVDNVDGVVWMKWRDKRDVKDDYDQFKLFDPYGRDCAAEECIEQLLRATTGQELDPEDKHRARNGFLFIETVEPSTRQLMRYTRQLYRQKERDPKYASWAIGSEVISQPIEKLTARYGITWDDISTREDREHWVAGGSLKIVDLPTNEVIAERVGYLMDPGLGSRVGFRTPWALARRMACPAFPSGMHRYPATDNVLFVLTVLKPVEEK